jgi:hypothetical protein
MIYAVMLCAVVGGRVDFNQCQMLQQSADLAECQLTIANQTSGVDLRNAPTRLLCMQKSVPSWAPVR